VRALEIVEALPPLKLGVEDLRIVDDHACEHPLELLVASLI